MTEKELKTYYDENKAMFVQKEQVKATHILFKTQEAAVAVKERIRKGESFEEVAKALSIGPNSPKGGDVDWFEKKQMVPEFGNSAFSLAIDGVSDPVKTQFGYHIIKVYGKKAAGTKSFADVRAEMERTLIGNKQKESVEALIRKERRESRNNLLKKEPNRPINPLFCRKYQLRQNSGHCSYKSLTWSLYPVQSPPGFHIFF